MTSAKRISGAVVAGADVLRNARGWRRLVLAAAIGALAALAFAPFFLFPLLLLGYAALVLLLDGAMGGTHRLRAAFFTGWAFGFGHFLVGMHWVGYAFMVDPDTFAWLLPFVALLLPGGLALYPALAALFYAQLARPGWGRIFLFAFIFGAVEWLRGHLFTGLPWNLPAYGWGVSLAVLQSASLIGAYGLSLLTLLFGASLALLVPGPQTRRAAFLPAAMVALFALLWVGGALRLSEASDAMVPGVRLRIVQPDVPQNEKYLPQLRERNWARLIGLSRAPAAVPPTHIIWPEAAPPFPLSRATGALDDVALLTARGGIVMTGAERGVGDAEGKVRFYNSFFIFGAGAMLLGVYDKFHLVPFGEYLPFQDTLDAIGLTKLTGGSGGFAPGNGPRTLNVPGAPPAGVLICYEAIFPGEVTGSPRPQWLVNVTDDSWFGPGPGPDQHLLTARVRAIEEGLPIARAANTGISAVIDGYGRMRASLALGEEGVLDAGLPAALPPTLFVRFGRAIILVLFMFLGGAALWPLRLWRA